MSSIFQNRTEDGWPERIWLMDNGSLRPDATLQLREICRKLGHRIGSVVEPVSLLHASKVDPQLLGGEPARTFERSLKAAWAEGVRRIWVQPFFFGPSRAITDYLPQRLKALNEACPGLEIRVGPVLVPDYDPAPEWLLDLLLDHVEQTARTLDEPVVLVDHGTPVRAVNQVRDRLAALLDERWLGPVVPASMERREGDAYAFNEPLLERVFAQQHWVSGRVTVLMLFLLPGRHAGAEGDVAGILKDVKQNHPGLELEMSPLVGEHPAIVDAIASRLHEGLAGKGA